MKQISASLKIYLGIIAVFWLIKLLFTIFPVEFPIRGQEMAFSWPFVAIIPLMGLAGIWLARKTGFPEIWDTRVTIRQRLAIPAIVGLVYGLVTVVPLVIGKAYSLHPDALASDIHVKFPFSVPFYIYGTIFLETFLKLFCLTLIVYVISNLICRGRYQNAAFWFAAVVVSLYEPLPYILKDIEGRTGFEMVVSVGAHIVDSLFISNMVSAYLFRKYGFLAPVVMRLSHYLIWHVIYGGLT